MLNHDQLDSLIADAMREAIIPGMAIAIIEGDEVTHAKGYGVTSTEPNGLPVTPDTLFRIGSVTKPLTGMLIMRLVERGDLDLDMPIVRYLSWLRMSDPMLPSQITLRMLLSHTSGLPTGLTYNSDISTLEEYVETVIPRLTPVAPPDTVYHYSNHGINLAGYIAERVTDTPYTALMRDLVFEPLDMHRTTFDPLIAMRYRLSQSFILDADTNPIVKRPWVDNPSEYPCGFAISTVCDLANVAIMQINEGQFRGEQFLRPESVREMHWQYTSLLTWDDRSYGLTFRTRDYKGARVVWHTGAIAKFAAALVIVPEQRIGLTVTINRGVQAWGWLDKITCLVLDSLATFPIATVPTIPPPPEALPSAYVGAYVGSSTGLAIIAHDSDTLTLSINHADPLPLTTTDNQRFVAMKPTGTRTSIGFPDDSGQFVRVDGMLCIRFDYNATFAPDMAVWAEMYAGTYVGDTDTYTVRFDDGRMYLYCEDERTEAVCIPLDETTFASSLGAFKFELGEDGRASALVSIWDEWHYERVESEP